MLEPPPRADLPAVSAGRSADHALDPPAAASDARSLESLFLSQLAIIERVIAWVCARRRLRGADAEDFASVARIRLIENGYDVLRRFEGRSSLKTYLTAVINRFYLDFQVRRFGKWRPSAEAKRLGAVALRLEQLLFRDRLTLDEACGVLLSDPLSRTTRDALVAISGRIPRRPGRGPAALGAAAPAVARGAHRIERSERQALADRVFFVIRRSLAALPARERLLMRLHLDAGLTIAEVSRSLGADQKALYRKKQALLERLRADLEQDGIRADDAHDLLATLDWDASLACSPEAAASSGRFD